MDVWRGERDQGEGGRWRAKDRFAANAVARTSFCREFNATQMPPAPRLSPARRFLRVGEEPDWLCLLQLHQRPAEVFGMQE